MPKDIIAILRGVHPDEVVAIGDVLIQCGIPQSKYHRIPPNRLKALGD